MYSEISNINLNALDEHPAECRQEEEVEESGDEAAHGRVRGGVEAAEKEDLGEQEAEAEVPVYGGALAAEAPHAREHVQADD